MKIESRKTGQDSRLHCVLSLATYQFHSNILVDFFEEATTARKELDLTEHLGRIHIHV